MTIEQAYALNVVLLIVAMFALALFNLRIVYEIAIVLLITGSLLGSMVGTFFSIITALIMFVLLVFIGDMYLKKYHKSGLFR